MSKIIDGGPAFPMPSGNEPRVNETTHYNEGMSLRDYFAGQFMAAIITTSDPKHSNQFNDYLSSEDINGSGAPLEDGSRTPYDCFLKWGPSTAYHIADAMLAARGVKP